VLDWINRSSQAVAQLQLLRAEAATKRAELKENEENVRPAPADGGCAGRGLGVDCPVLASAWPCCRRLQLHFLRKQTEEATGMPGPAAGKETQTEREARRRVQMHADAAMRCCLVVGCAL